MDHGHGTRLALITTLMIGFFATSLRATENETIRRLPRVGPHRFVPFPQAEWPGLQGRRSAAKQMVPPTPKFIRPVAVWKYTSVSPVEQISKLSTGRVELGHGAGMGTLHPPANAPQLEFFDIALNHLEDDAAPALLEEQEGDDESVEAYDLEQIEIAPGVYFEDGLQGCHSGWLWMFAAESTFLVPDSDCISVVATLETPDQNTHFVPGNNMHFGPRITFGMDFGHWRVLGRFWHQSGYSDDLVPFVPGTGQTGMVVNSGVEAYTADLEFGKRFCCSDAWNFDFNIGLRYASLEDFGYLSVAQSEISATPALVYANASAITDVSGPGLTLAVGGDKPIHLFCCSWLEVFWKVRGSMVFGPIKSSAQTAVFALDPLPFATSTRYDAAFARTDDELAILEAQIGLRWEHTLKCAPAVAFVTAAFEHQWWDADGGVAGVQSVATANEHSAFASALAGPDIEVSMVGFSLGGGLTW